MEDAPIDQSYSQSSPNHSDYKPKYFNLLSDEDKDKYTNLRSTLSSHLCRNRRGKRLENFVEMLAAIQNFCIRNNENYNNINTNSNSNSKSNKNNNSNSNNNGSSSDNKSSDDNWKRCLVCGVCWLPNGIAINTRQLGLLIDKCKSSINGSLQKMGYSTLQNRGESVAPLVEAIPALKNNFGELREWTVRLFMAATPQPNLPTYDVSTSFPFASPAPQRAQCYGYPTTPFLNIAPPNINNFNSMKKPSKMENLKNMKIGVYPDNNFHLANMNPNMSIKANIPFYPQNTINNFPTENNIKCNYYPPKGGNSIQCENMPQFQRPSSQAPQIPQNNSVFNANLNNNEIMNNVTTGLSDNENNNNNNEKDIFDFPNPDDNKDDGFFNDPFLLAPDFLMNDNNSNDPNHEDPFAGFGM